MATTAAGTNTSGRTGCAFPLFGFVHVQSTTMWSFPTCR